MLVVRARARGTPRPRDREVSEGTTEPAPAGAPDDSVRRAPTLRRTGAGREVYSAGGVQRISPCRTANHPAGCSTHSRQAREIVRQLGRVGVPAVDGLPGDRRVDDPVRPQAAPPAAVLGRREAPGRRARRHRARTGRVRPGQQVPRRRPARPRCRGRPPGRSPASGRAADRPGTRSSPRSRRPGRRPRRRRGRPAASRAAPPTGSPRCCSTWWACTTSKVSSAASRAYTSPVRKVIVSSPAAAARARADSSGPAAGSMASTRPGATRPAMSTLIVPGPQPTSSTVGPGHQPVGEVGRRVGHRSRPCGSAARSGRGRACRSPGRLAWPSSCTVGGRETRLKPSGVGASFEG